MALKKKKIVRRAKTGLAAVPTKSFEDCKYYFQYDVDRKDIASLCKDYVKKTYSKKDAKAILANPEYEFATWSYVGATIFWLNHNLEFNDKNQVYLDNLPKHFGRLLETGAVLLAEKTEAEEVKTNVVRLTPQQLIARKVNDTIMVDIDELEDAWIDGEKTEIDLYNLVKKHEIKGGGIDIVMRRIESWLSEYKDAYDKTCEQAVEGYSHLKRSELRRRVKACENMLDDLSKAKDAQKATRSVRVAKPKAADKQIARLQYKKEDKDFKIASINPVSIIGAMRVVIFNAKYKTLIEYISDRPNGFEVKGTTLQGFDVETSRAKTLRKPDEQLPMFKKTIKQFDKLFGALTTKESKPNGRINKECVILRVD